MTTFNFKEMARKHGPKAVGGLVCGQLGKFAGGAVGGMVAGPPGVLVGRRVGGVVGSRVGSMAVGAWLASRS